MGDCSIRKNNEEFIFDFLILDYYFEVVDGGDGEDDEEDNKSDWLFDLQEPGGERVNAQG